MAATDISQRSDSDSLREAFRTVARSWPVVLIAAIVGGGAALLYASVGETKTYSSTSTLSFSTAPFGQVLVGSYTTGDPERQVQTAASLVTLPPVQERTAARLRRQDLNSNINISASPADKANLMTITASADSPRVAAAAADAAAAAFLAYSRTLNERTIASAKRVLTEQSGTANTRGNRLALIAKRNNLDSVKALIDNQIDVVGRAAVPVASSSTPTSQIVAVGVIIGLLIGVAISLLRTPRRRGETL